MVSPAMFFQYSFAINCGCVRWFRTTAIRSSNVHPKKLGLHSSIFFCLFWIFQLCFWLVSRNQWYRVFFPSKGIEIESEQMELESQIQHQNEQYFAVYNYIAMNVSRTERIAILKANAQAVPATDAQVRPKFMLQMSRRKQNKTLTLPFCLGTSSLSRCDLFWRIVHMRKVWKGSADFQQLDIQMYIWVQMVDVWQRSETARTIHAESSGRQSQEISNAWRVLW